MGLRLKELRIEVRMSREVQCVRGTKGALLVVRASCLVFGCMVEGIGCRRVPLWIPRRALLRGPRGCETISDTSIVQGHLTHKTHPSTQGQPYGPKHEPDVGS